MLKFNDSENRRPKSGCIFSSCGNIGKRRKISCKWPYSRHCRLLPPHWQSALPDNPFEVCRSAEVRMFLKTQSHGLQGYYRSSHAPGSGPTPPSPSNPAAVPWRPHRQHTIPIHLQMPVDSATLLVPLPIVRRFQSGPAVCRATLNCAHSLTESMMRIVLAVHSMPRCEQLAETD